MSRCSWNSSSCDFQYGFDFNALSQKVHAKFFGAGVEAVEMVERRDDAVDRREDAALYWVKDESVDAMDERGSDNMLGTLLDGTLKYEEARLPTVDMDDLSAPESRKPSPPRAVCKSMRIC